MSATTLAIGALMLGIVAMSFAFGGGAVVVALPLAVIVIAAVGLMDFRRSRRVGGDRPAKDDEEQIEFTARDKQTLA